MKPQPDSGCAGENGTNDVPHPTPAFRRAEQMAIANKRRAEILPLISAMRARGTTTLVGLANELNKRGIPAPRGGQWTATQVSRLL